MKTLEAIVWGPSLIALILGLGVYLSVRTGFAQLRLLPHAVRTLKSREKGDGVTPFRALCTALGATVGTGNLAGVAGAIALGGPGAVFWLWISCIFGMLIKCAEVTLAVTYRKIGKNGEYIGGPMYMMADGLKMRKLAAVYAALGVVGCLGIGNATQVNTLLGGFHSIGETFGIPASGLMDMLCGLAIALFAIRLLSGGGRRIGKAAEKLVPFASAFYVLLCLVFLCFRIKVIPAVLGRILEGAFHPRAITGGMVGSVFLCARMGISRGIFSNEAGMGTASIAHAGAQTDIPCRQGMLGILEVFIDTGVICTMTALVILTSGVPIYYGMDMGIQLTVSAFSSVYGKFAGFAITGILCLLSFSTVLGWGLYGLRCAEYLFGERFRFAFILFQGVVILVGAVMPTDKVWSLAQTMNGLMAAINVPALFALSSEFTRQIREYSLTIRERLC